MRSFRRDLSAAAAFAGPPSVAHAEALLRAVEARSHASRRTARRDLRRRPADDAASPARAAEPAARRLPRARPGAPALARQLPRRRRRDADPAQPFSPPLRAPDAAAVQGRLPGPTSSWITGARGAGGGRTRRRDRRAGHRGVPRGANLPSAAPVRRLGRLRACSQPARVGDRGRLPRLGRRAPARLRPRRQRRGRPRARPRPGRRQSPRRLPARPAVLSTPSVGY